jgi:hypothetical protein
MLSGPGWTPSWGKIHSVTVVGGVEAIKTKSILLLKGYSKSNKVSRSYRQ